MKSSILAAMIGQFYSGHEIIAINPAVGGRYEIVFKDRRSLAVRDIDWFYDRILQQLPQQPQPPTKGACHESTNV